MKATRLTLTLPDHVLDYATGATVADVLDALALADDIRPGGAQGRASVAKALLHQACLTALRERDDVAFLVNLRHEYGGDVAATVDRRPPLRVVS